MNGYNNFELKRSNKNLRKLEINPSKLSQVKVEWKSVLVSWTVPVRRAKKCKFSTGQLCGPDGTSTPRSPLPAPRSPLPALRSPLSALRSPLAGGQQDGPVVQLGNRKRGKGEGTEVKKIERKRRTWKGKKKHVGHLFLQIALRCSRSPQTTEQLFTFTENY